jgi:hypothetical protein
MHALTCDILQVGDKAYALVPMYYQYNRFLVAEVHIEYVCHFEKSIFYHAIVSDILMPIDKAFQVLSVSLVRCINRKTGKIGLQRIPTYLTLDKLSMLQQIQVWQRDFVLDIPAPFVVGSRDKLIKLEQQVLDYFNEVARTAIV